MTNALEVLAAADLPSVLAGATDQTCYSFCIALASAASAAEEGSDVQRLLLLLSDAAAFWLRPNDDPALASRSAYFDRRVQAVDDFDQEQLTVLDTIVEHVASEELRARVADILFIRRRHNRFVPLAVDAYLETADQKYALNDVTHASDRYVRAFVISGRDRVIRDRVVTKIAGVLNARRPDDGYFTAWIMDAMLDRRVGDPTVMAALARDAVSVADAQSEWNRARSYLRLEGAWLALGGDEAGRIRTRIDAAERLVRLAETEESRSFAVAGMHLSAAIHEFRQVPGQQTRVEGLLRRLDETQRTALGELARFTEQEDITERAKAVRDYFAGRSKLDALARFVDLYAAPNVAELKRVVEEESRDFISQRLVPMVFVNSRGRVTARRNAIGAGSPEEQERTLIRASYERAHKERSFRVHLRVLPAWRQIVEDHHFTENELIELVAASPFCPMGRESLFTRGIVAGFRGDFAVALYVLVPQVENAIRCALENRGATTWRMDDDGIQQDKDLGSLLFMREATDVFGEDLLFELRGLFIEKSGTNLRNLAAHGLLSDAESASDHCVYFWWLTLYLLFKPMITPPRQATASQSTPGEPADAPSSSEGESTSGNEGESDQVSSSAIEAPDASNAQS